MNVAKALTIAGSDSGGGAGIQADLKTFQELEAYGMSALTTVTAQNTFGVQGVYDVPVSGVVDQLNSIGNDLTPDAVKTGMLFSKEIIEAVAERVSHYNWSNLVVDPVMIAKGGAKLLQDDAVQAIKENLLPLAKVVTPNIPEAEVLANLNINTIEDRKKAARIIHSSGPEFVLIKGGHDTEETVRDFLFDGDRFISFDSNRYPTKNTHGTGCTFSAAITAQLAKGASVNDSIEIAKAFIQEAIEQDLHIGAGHGPTNHWAYQKRGALS